MEVQIAEATRHTYRIQSQGTALPRTSIRLVSEVSGKVVSVAESFDVGQIFAKGDVLLKIDSRDYELALAQARSQVAQAQLRLQMEVKEADVVRREWQLLNQGEPTGLQAREPQLASARAALEAALAAEEAAKRNLDRCEIRAPFDGMVARASVRPGQFAALATPLGELFATDVAEVRLPLIASDLSFIDLPRPGAKVALGQAPKVTLSARAGERRTEWLWAHCALGGDGRSDEPDGLRGGTGHRPVWLGQARRRTAAERDIRAGQHRGPNAGERHRAAAHALRGRNQVWIVSGKAHSRVAG